MPPRFLDVLARRRLLLRLAGLTTADLGADALAPSTAAPGAAHPDAALLGACAAFSALEHDKLALFEGPGRIEDDEAHDAAIEPIWARQAPLLDQVCAPGVHDARGPSRPCGGLLALGCGRAGLACPRLRHARGPLARGPGLRSGGRAVTTPAGVPRVPGAGATERCPADRQRRRGTGAGAACPPPRAAPSWVGMFMVDETTADAIRRALQAASRPDPCKSRLAGAIGRLHLRRW